MATNPILNQLLVQSIQATPTGAPSRPNPTPMDPETRKWLEEAIQEVTYDVTAKMKEYIEVIKKPDSKTNDELCEALMGLQFECEQIDAAIDVYKLRGTQPVIDLMTHSDSDVRKYAAWVLATCMSQNPEVHRQLAEFNPLPKFLDLVQRESDPEVAQKLLLCISALVRENATELLHFRELGGYQLLGSMCQHTSSKVRCKAAFMLFAFLSKTPDLLEQIVLSNNLISTFSEFLNQSLKTVMSGEVEEPVASGIQHVLAALCLFLPNISPSILEQARRCQLALTLRQLEAEAAKHELLRNIVGDVLPKSAGFQAAS